MKVQIFDWQKYVGRKGIENPRWFSFQKHLLNDSKYFGRFDPAMIAAFCYACCQALGSDNGEAELNPIHAAAYIGLNEVDLISALIKLKELQILHTDVRPVFTENTPVCTVEYDKGKNDTAAHACAAHEQRTYVLDEFPKKKKEKKPKPELSCDALPQFTSLKALIESRKIPTLLQEKWLNLYHPSFIAKTLQKADAWAVANNVEKKNWAQFFNNWLIRDNEKGTPQQQTFQPPKVEPPRGPQLSAWQKMELERERREAAEKGSS